jgi:hypothetical protein
MRYDDESLGQLARNLAAGWPGDAFLAELQSRRTARRLKAVCWTLGAVALVVAAMVLPLARSLGTGSSEHPHGGVSTQGHACDAGDDVGTAFRAALQAEELGDRSCAIRNFNRVVQLTASEHAHCSVADHPVDAQVAIARWELARLAEKRGVGGKR